jgi:hypothetical protein
MKNPCVYGKMVTGDNFCNRIKKENIFNRVLKARFVPLNLE